MRTFPHLRLAAILAAALLAIPLFAGGISITVDGNTGDGANNATLKLDLATIADGSSTTLNFEQHHISIKGRRLTAGDFQMDLPKTGQLLVVTRDGSTRISIDGQLVHEAKTATGDDEAADPDDDAQAD